MYLIKILNTNIAVSKIFSHFRQTTPDIYTSMLFTAYNINKVMKAVIRIERSHRKINYYFMIKPYCGHCNSRISLAMNIK